MYQEMLLEKMLACISALLYDLATAAVNQVLHTKNLPTLCYCGLLLTEKPQICQRDPNPVNPDVIYAKT